MRIWQNPEAAIYTADEVIADLGPDLTHTQMPEMSSRHWESFQRIRPNGGEGYRITLLGDLRFCVRSLVTDSVGLPGTFGYNCLYRCVDPAWYFWSGTKSGQNVGAYSADPSVKGAFKLLVGSGRHVGSNMLHSLRRTVTSLAGALVTASGDQSNCSVRVALTPIELVELG